MFLRIFIIFFVGITLNLLGKEKAKPIVSCRVQGQFGNQLFQIATTLAYAWDNKAKPIFPELNRNDCNQPYNRENFFFRLNTSLNKKPFLHTYVEPIWHSSEPIPYKPDQFLVGYFQSWKHFHHHRNRLIGVFKPSSTRLISIQQKYSSILTDSKTVAIHVRTFNKALHDSGEFPFLGMEYYERAMNLFPNDYTFVIFSDRINWCKQHFSKMFKDKNLIFIEGNDHITDFILMSMMRNQILANSSFSWWSAYLNTNSKKIVVVPQYWMRPDCYAFPPPQPNTFFLDEWIVVSPNWDEPYPEDIKNYDKASKSIDN